MPSVTLFMFLTVPAALVVVASVVGRGRLQIAQIRLRWWGLVVAAAAFQTVFTNGWLSWVLADETACRLSVGGSLLLVGAFAALNWRGRRRVERLGFSVVLLGALANALPQMVYGAMPFRVDAARAAGLPEESLDGALGHMPMTTVDHELFWLSDAIAFPPLTMVLSVGDLLLVTGVAAILAGLARRVDLPDEGHASADDAKRRVLHDIGKRR